MSDWKGSPYLIKVEAGDTVAFCQCLESDNPPYCDGSHQGSESGKRPKVVKFEEADKIYACGCGDTGEAPYCDGSHNKLP